MAAHTLALDPQTMWQITTPSGYCRIVTRTWMTYWQSKDASLRIRVVACWVLTGVVVNLVLALIDARSVWPGAVVGAALFTALMFILVPLSRGDHR